MGKVKINTVQIALIVIILVIVGFFAYKKFLAPKSPGEWDDILTPLT